jgi:anti-anti-sigma factor
MNTVTITRIGTQVVVRLSGDIGDSAASRLQEALDEVAALVLQRVVVDLEEVRSIDGAGLDFIALLHSRWQLRLLNTPADLRSALPSHRAGAPTGPIPNGSIPTR